MSGIAIFIVVVVAVEWLLSLCAAWCFGKASAFRDVKRWLNEEGEAR